MIDCYIVTDLQTMYMTMAGVPDSDTQAILDEIKERYRDMIDALNLDFQFTADVISSHEVHYIQQDNIVNIQHHPDIEAAEP